MGYNSSFVPPSGLVRECRLALQAWAKAERSPLQAERSPAGGLYLIDGKERVLEALAALERGDFSNSSPITADFHDAGFDYDDRVRDYSLIGITYISSVLTGRMDVQEFYRRLHGG
jgi:hypothetical protein